LESLREHLRNEQLERLLRRTRHSGLRRRLHKCLRQLLPAARAA
jgi:hypothetical protein